MPLSTLKPLGRETLWDGAYAALRALLSGCAAVVIGAA